MAPEKDPPSQTSATNGRKPLIPYALKPRGALRDSDLALSPSGLKRDAERVEADKPNCKVEAIQTLLVI